MALGGQWLASARIAPFRNPKAVRTVAAAGVLAVLFGAVAFVLLVLRDHGHPRVMVNEQARPAPHPNAQAPVTSSAPSIAPRSNKGAAQPSPITTPALPAGKKAFLASEVSGPIAVGPLRLNVTDTDNVNHTYDLRVQSGHRTYSHRHIRIDQPLWISTGRGKAAIQLVVTRVEGDTVAGYWSEVTRSARVSSTSRVKHR